MHISNRTISDYVISDKAISIYLPLSNQDNMPISLFRISLILVGTLIVTTSLYGQDRLTGQTFATRSDVIAENGMVVTHHPLAGQIALDILKQGEIGRASCRERA